MQIRSNSFDPSQRPYPGADFTRPNRETIESETPEPASADDVRARLANQRQEAAARSERTAEAREKAQRIHNARHKYMADRTSNAREQLAESEGSASSTAKRIKNARSQYMAQRVGNARANAPEGGNSATVTPTAGQVEQAREVQESLMAARATPAGDKVSLSETTLRLQADATEGGATKADHIKMLREMYRAGTLNSRELMTRAANLLLSGE